MSKVSKYLNFTTQKERDQMFDYYVQVRFTGGIAEVSRKFNRSRKTIYRWKRLDRWDQRYDKIKSKLNSRVDKAIERRDSRNIGIVRQVKDSIFEKLLKQLKNKTYQVTVSELVSLIRLEVELTGELPSADGDNIVNIFNTIPALDNDKQREKVYGNLAKIFGTGNGDQGINIPKNRFVASDN